MRISTVDRNWLLAGGVAALLLVAIGWFFVVSPQNNSTTSLKSQTVDQQQQTTTLHHDLDQLRADSTNLAKYKAELALAQQALPTSSGMPDFLRELQTIGSTTGVSVTDIGVSAPIPVVAAAPVGASATSTSSTSPHVGSVGAVYSVQIAVTASGTLDGLNAFLQQMQQVQPRAVLVISINEAPSSAGGSTTLNVNLQAFVAPNSTSASTPTPTATPTS